MNPLSENEIETFMARRPEYTEAHVREIAEAMDREGVPFCRKCDDWHNVNEECSQ